MPDFLDEDFIDAANSVLEELGALDRAARAGKIGKVEDYFARQSLYSDGADEKSFLLQAIIDHPDEYCAKDRLLGSITQGGFDFVNFFSETPELTEDTIFLLYGKNPEPDTARAAGILAAEYLRFKIAGDVQYRLDIDSLFKREGQAENGLSGEAAFVRARDSIIAVQNALVDYVRGEGPSLPLNRGAAMLLLLEEDLRAQGDDTTANLWTRKITGITPRRVESLKHGETVRYKPVFRI